jgi:hypothetical protein
MTEHKFAYWVFLCHCQPDNVPDRPASDGQRVCWGDWWQEELKNYLVPTELAGQLNACGETVPERIGPIFQDLTAASDDAGLSESARQALEQARFLVVVCSPRSAKSPRVNETVRYFKLLGRGSRILPVVVAGEPNASGQDAGNAAADNECFVPALRHPVRPDGSLDTTRSELGFIFADARQLADRREVSAEDEQNGAVELATAKIQLIAGILGVGFSGLWGHEIKRRFAEAKVVARDARPPNREDSHPAEAAKPELLAARQHIEELRNELRAAQAQVLAAQQPMSEVAGQVAAARSQAVAAESKALEARQQVHEAQAQLEAARHQILELQTKFLGMQNLAPDLQSQIEAVQTVAREAQRQLDEVRKQASQAEGEVAVARNEARAGQNNLLEAQRQVREAQNRVREIEDQAGLTQSQLAAAQNLAQLAEIKALDAQQKVRTEQSQTDAVREEARALNERWLEAQRQLRAAQIQAQEIQAQSRASRRLTQVFAILAVLALIAAASLVLWQQKKLAAAKAGAGAVMAVETVPLSRVLDREQIQQALRQFAGVRPDPKLFRSLDELAAQIPVAEIPDALNLAAALLDDPQRGHFQEELLGHWCQTNSTAAFDWSCQLTNMDFQQRSLEKIIPALPAENFTNQVARLNALNPLPGEQIYALLFQRWAESDPVQAIEQRTQIPGHDAEGQIVSAILDTWGEQHPEAALNWLAAQPDSTGLPAGTWRDALMVDLIDGWAARDLESAAAACEELPAGRAKTKARERVLSQRIAQAPALAAALVHNLPPGDYRQQALAELCQHWLGTNTPTLLDWAESLPSATERNFVTNQFVTNWAGEDPAAAAQFASQHAELPGNVLGEIAGAWFPNDFAATTNWIAGLSGGEKKDAVLLTVVEPWAERDPQGMMAFAFALPAGELQTRFLTAASRQLAARDFSKTVECLQPLSDPALRQGILEAAARNCDLARLNPAAEFIAAMPVGDDQQAAMRGLLATWTATDPEAAANWVAAFPETNPQPEAAADILKTWSQSEPSAAANWLTHSPARTGNQAMISALIEGSLVKYPAFAAEWTLSVADEKLREKFQFLVAREWIKADPTAATRWIDSLNLPDETKHSLKASGM